MDHERDHDSMDELLGPINSSNNSNNNNNLVTPMGPHSGKLQLLLPKAATLCYGALNENDHNLFEGMLSNDANINTKTTANTAALLASTSTTCTSRPDLPNLVPSIKRSLIPGVY